MKKLLTILSLLLVFTLTACNDSEGHLVTNEYEITFVSNGGSVVGSINVEGLVTTSLPEDPTKEGYTFAGWYVEENFQTLVSDGITVTTDTTLYARWEDNYYQFRVTLNLWDGEKAFYDFDYGEVTFIPATRQDGYNFKGWFYDVELTEPFDYKETLTSDINLYAKFDPVESIIFIIFNNYLVERFVVDYDEVVTLTEHDLEGFTFEGYYTEIEHTNQITTITGTKSSQYIYAKYSLAADNVDLTSLAYYDYLSPSNPVISITVEDYGVMTLELFPAVAQNTVDNFIQYALDQDYSGSSFHRIINGFMIQGGIIESNNCSIEGEFSSNGVTNNLSHTRGVISMARTSSMNSATSQFFIVHEDSDFLDGNYAAFGGLTSGFNILELIAYQLRDAYDKPYVDIVITSITVELNGYVPGTPICAE
ncbi:Peptidyl-prolyl cis-trans isomerase B [Candidatus Izimaplasma bacterium HR1]|jgi:peptidyl-prolyl cis-trans isomerase B (cyclophilin B)|uniref:peptidylprolyl isomerase n=1 Tax=Candidatus Izimoplasma sp. HR1 TaxID=1541959 RepID=UPI0004F6E6B8|nr:Peptidyl-prolyl cis-trans isomerase B [Candidatus Izimaplasma bacterium HR1]